MVVQISTCINAVRQKPDTFACQYPCSYADWRDDAVSPVRGPMAFAGTPGTDELNRRAAWIGLSLKHIEDTQSRTNAWGCSPRGANPGST